MYFEKKFFFKTLLATETQFHEITDFSSKKMGNNTKFPYYCNAISVGYWTRTKETQVLIQQKPTM